MSDRLRRPTRRVGFATASASAGTHLPRSGGIGWRLLALVAFLFYLPFLDILPFAYIRTDLTARRLRLGRRAVHHRAST